jgi:hypothetical protein
MIGFDCWGRERAADSRQRRFETSLTSGALMIGASGSWRATRALLLGLLLAGCASVQPPLPPPPLHPNGQALWRIIHDQCVPDERAHDDPSPCALVRPSFW